MDGAAAFGSLHEAQSAGSSDIGAHNTIITFGYVLGRVAGPRRRVSILDWGGGIGHYYEYARRLRPDLELDYIIKDMAPTCEIGCKLVPDVVFTSDEAQALPHSYDLVFASSSLQYSRDFYGVLARLCDPAAGWLMVTRSPFVNHNDDFIVVQRPHRYGYLTEYPAWFINRSRFLAAVGRAALNSSANSCSASNPMSPTHLNSAATAGFYSAARRISPRNNLASPERREPTRITSTTKPILLLYVRLIRPRRRIGC
jgi:putative methyltransferase (TIGR04325 family)